MRALAALQPVSCTLWQLVCMGWPLVNALVPQLLQKDRADVQRLIVRDINPFHNLLKANWLSEHAAEQTCIV